MASLALPWRHWKPVRYEDRMCGGEVQPHPDGCMHLQARGWMESDHVCLVGLERRQHWAEWKRCSVKVKLWPVKSAGWTVCEHAVVAWMDVMDFSWFNPLYMCPWGGQGSNIKQPPPLSDSTVTRGPNPTHSEISVTFLNNTCSPEQIQFNSCFPIPFSLRPHQKPHMTVKCKPHHLFLCQREEECIFPPRRITWSHSQSQALHERSPPVIKAPTLANPPPLHRASAMQWSQCPTSVQIPLWQVVSLAETTFNSNK